MEFVRTFRSHLREIERQVSRTLKDQTTCCGVTMAQCHLLLEMGDRESHSIAELTTRLQLDASTLSRTVDGLVRAGLLNRGENPNNRRSNLLSFTAKGRQIQKEINRGCDRFYSRLLARVPAAGRDPFLKAVETLAAMLSEEIPFAGCGTADTRENTHG